MVEELDVWLLVEVLEMGVVVRLELEMVVEVIDEMVEEVEVTAVAGPSIWLATSM